MKQNAMETGVGAGMFALMLGFAIWLVVSAMPRPILNVPADVRIERLERAVERLANTVAMYEVERNLNGRGKPTRVDVQHLLGVYTSYLIAEDSDAETTGPLLIEWGE